MASVMLAPVAFVAIGVTVAASLLGLYAALAALKELGLLHRLLPLGGAPLRPSHQLVREGALCVPAAELRSSNLSFRGLIRSWGACTCTSGTLQVAGEDEPAFTCDSAHNSMDGSPRGQKTFTPFQIGPDV